MLHQTRNWAITPIEDLAAAAEGLSEHHYGLTAAFRTPAGTVWANDSITEGSLQEYAVLRPDGHGRYRQVETITVSWCSAAKLCDYLRYRPDRCNFTP